MTSARRLATDSSTTGAVESKPGVQTSEFWKTLVFVVLSVLTGLNIIGPDFADRYAAIIDAAAFLAGAIATAGYSLARGRAKSGVGGIAESPVDLDTPVIPPSSGL